MNYKNIQNALILILSITFTANVNATWSIIAVDRDTGEIGIAGASCTFDVQGIASIVPGKGAIVVQAASSYFARMKGVELMNKNISPSEILKAMNNKEFEPEKQQYGIVALSKDTKPLVHSGSSIKGWKGSKIGDDFAVQGNILVSEEVIGKVFTKYNSMRKKPMADRLMNALKAGEISGGDKRCGSQYARSAFISVYNPIDGAIVKLSVYGIQKSGKAAVTMLEQQFIKIPNPDIEAQL